MSSRAVDQRRRPWAWPATARRDVTPGTPTHLVPSRGRDALLLPALYVLNCLLFSQWHRLGDVPAQPELLLVWLYGAVLLVPLVWRDAAPVAVFVIEWVLTVASWPFMPLFTPVTVMPVALYALVVRGGTTVSMTALSASFVSNGICAAVAFRTHTDAGAELRQFVANAITLTVVTLWVWGMARIALADRRHLERLERERESVRNAVREERGRIAGELHDIVSHAVTVIVLQAAGARRIVDIRPDQLEQSLTNIELTGKQAMTELRRLLGVLNADDPTVRSAGPDELAPRPGLKDIAPLIDSLHDAGMPVCVRSDGEPRSLDPSVELAAYRIVQEGLTNVLKHGDKDALPRVRLLWGRHDLRIEIHNEMTPAGGDSEQGPSNGMGLVGLRERVAAAGGWLDAGPRDDGQFRLATALPLKNGLRHDPSG